MILLAFEVKNLALPASFTSFVLRLDSIYGLDARTITNTTPPSFWLPCTEPLVGILFFLHFRLSWNWFKRGCIYTFRYLQIYDIHCCINIYIYTHAIFCCIKGSNHLRLFTAVSDTMSPLWVSSWGVGLSLPLATCCRVIGFVCGTRDVEDVVRWRCLGNSRCWGWSDRCGADAFCLWPYGWSWKGRIPVDETLRPCHLEN